MPLTAEESIASLVWVLRSPLGFPKGTACEMEALTSEPCRLSLSECGIWCLVLAVSTDRRWLGEFGRQKLSCQKVRDG